MPRPRGEAPARAPAAPKGMAKNHETMISIANLKKSYGQTTACDIESLDIADGEIVGIVGNNGAGKTTLFRLMLDLAKPDTGHVTTTPPPHRQTACDVQGPVDVAGSEEWKLFTGAYLNESFLIDYLTPDEYFAFLAKISGLGTDEMKLNLERFEAFDAGEVLGQHKLIRDLSAGNRQKAGIMAAFATSPSVAILDEPFNYLDPQSQNRLKRVVEEYNRETGATILISSHNLAHTINISTRIILLEHGHVISDIPNNGDSAAREIENYFSAD